MRTIQEPGFVRTLRESLINLTSSERKVVHCDGPFYMNDATLISLASRPDDINRDVIDHVEPGFVERVPWTGLAAPRLGIIDMAHKNNDWPQSWGHDRSGHILFTMPSDLEWESPRNAKGLSYELNVDMSLTRFLYQPGTCDVLPSASEIPNVDDVLMKDVTSRSFAFADVVNSHRTSDADVTWVLEKTSLPPPELGTIFSYPVWCNGKVVVRSIADILEMMNDGEPAYRSARVCVMKSSFIRRLVSQGMPFESWRKRRVNEQGVMTIRYERHLYEVTALPGVTVNYVTI